MRRGVVLLAVVAAAVLPASAADGKRSHHKHKPAGVKGVVLSDPCPRACTDPTLPEPAYTGSLTITVNRARDGRLVASQETSDGHFRMRVKRGSYDISAVLPNPPGCEPTPTIICPAGAQRPPIIAPCLTGETQRVQVRRHRFTRVELHVHDICTVATGQRG
jgi:hypothetical protein